jgi:hypothetical protein
MILGLLMAVQDIAGLGADSYERREAAMESLRAMKADALPEVRAALASPDFEVAARARRLYFQLGRYELKGRFEVRVIPMKFWHPVDEYVASVWTHGGRIDSPVSACQIKAVADISVVIRRSITDSLVCRFTEIQYDPQTNSVVVHSTADSLERIATALAGFDAAHAPPPGR